MEPCEWAPNSAEILLSLSKRSFHPGPFCYGTFPLHTGPVPTGHWLRPEHCRHASPSGVMFFTHH
jgi:hypothetical protein